MCIFSYPNLTDEKKPRAKYKVIFIMQTLAKDMNHSEKNHARSRIRLTTGVSEHSFLTVSSAHLFHRDIQDGSRSNESA